MDEYEEMRRELTNLSRTRSRSESQKPQDGPFRAITGGSVRSTSGRARRARTTSVTDCTAAGDKDLESGDAGYVSQNLS